MNRWTLAALLWLPPVAASAQAPKAAPTPAPKAATTQSPKAAPTSSAPKAAATPSPTAAAQSPKAAAAQAARAEQARAALLRTDVEWAKQAATGKDVERTISYWTDDAVIYPPKQAPVIGKEAIRTYVADSMKTPWFSIDWRPAQAVVAASGDVGYTTGTNTITVPDSNGKVVTSNGRYLTVWRRAANGPWRCVVDFWNEAPVPPAPKRPARPPKK